MPDTEKPRENLQHQPASTGPAGLRQRWLLNAGLLVLIGLLAWLALHRAGQEKDVAGPPLTTLAVETISQLRIERPDHTTIALEKTGAQWTLTAPVRARGSAGRRMASSA